MSVRFHRCAVTLWLVAMGWIANSRAGEAGAVAARDQERLIPDLALTLRWIPPGGFEMGAKSGGEDDERPVTGVTLTKGFWLGATEVTKAQWTAVTGTKAPNIIASGELSPVTFVSWNDAMDFCRKLTDREKAAGRLPPGFVFTLPTEAQWEYACRAGSTGDYAGDLEALGWYAGNSNSEALKQSRGETAYVDLMKNSRGEPQPVALKQANVWGLYDMHGNVWEWCLDWYGPYAGGSKSDPVGPSTGTFRVVRGGGTWETSAIFARSANRDWWEPAYRTLDLGFRVVLCAAVPESK